MKYIQTYEGLFDFFRKKAKQGGPVSYSYILDCLLDILDEKRITTSLDNPHEGFGLYVSPQEIVKTGCWKEEVGDLSFYVSNFDLIFIMKYDPSTIKDEEVNGILEDVKAHLKGVGCEMSFYVGFGYYCDIHFSTNLGRTYDKEYKDFITMSKRKMSTPDIRVRERHITVRIKSETGFIEE